MFNLLGLPGPIDVFFVDIDGCISEPFIAPEWEKLTELRVLSELSHRDNNVPRLCLCTGRPAPYAEAVCQWLDVREQAIFEMGAGILDVATQGVRYHPALPEQHLVVTDVVREYFQSLSQQYSEIHREVAKQVGVGITCSNKALVIELLPLVTQFVTNFCPELEVHHTDISIEAVWPIATKGEGIRWFCKEHNIELTKTAFIGDSSADISAINTVAFGFAPNNGHPSVKQAADYVMEVSVTEAVVDAWSMLTKHNLQFV